MNNSELILNPDGSIYHLHLLPEEVAPTIITVGDPDRVGDVSKYFDKIEVKRQKREFVTHTGTLKGKRLTVISTGIGTDNIDIVMNELDALFNIDLKEKTIKDRITPLTFVRIGTSGSLQEKIEIDSFLMSSHAIGLDSLMQFYDVDQSATELTIQDDFAEFLERQSSDLLCAPYCYEASKSLLELFNLPQKGITLTCSGFYGPQGRKLRAHPLDAKLHLSAGKFSIKGGTRITNMEMETAGIYGLARALKHQAVSLSAILANRVKGEFSAQPEATVDKLIQFALEKLTGE